MGTLINRGKQTSTRKYLRNNSTKVERLLWSKLKGSQVLDYKFRRQQGVGSYIIDFYCPEVMLAIEIDGETHLTPDEKEYDRIRQHEIEELGIQFLRFTNRDVYDNINGILQRIGERLLMLSKFTPDKPTPD
ncbi:MAG: endonuclease domain-containing protein [Bacteroidota bacterium]